ncbi:hypothetical protein A9Y76_28565 (plasmid) [Ralstonia insidiosa]|jgi:hypothetical protein|uniref:Uncharacterized protein n=1 Tax=Ralstonia insidiosa TaxID=190721 RepID=A0A192A8E0_9RALS|nr:hypothetical protein A9Y76_28565 [Ralstonia insidiosa]KMW44142.1 hypothetical protein AC240_26755 [Ralstonia sp. MD27]MBA9884356.1 hypothetical protein [Ralstonia pickettii]MBA9869594.1 hypothetical protein [Ralstonia insidiosa]MBA9894155.1 hypothetical protein [Ralstonia pickettii]
MSVFDVAAVGLVVLAIGDVALLLFSRESKCDWALRLTLAAALAVAALLIQQRDFSVGIWGLLVVLAGCCQAGLIWRRVADVKRGQH